MDKEAEIQEKVNERVRHKRNENVSTVKKMLIANIIIAIAFEIIMVFVKKTYAEFSIARLITEYGLFCFAGLHYALGIPNLYSKIVKHRFKISGIMIVVSTIMGFFLNDMSLVEWLKTTDVSLTLVWNIKFYAMLLISYEMFSIITDKKQGLSVIGTITLVFSTLVQLDFNNITPLLMSEGVIVFLNLLMTCKYNKVKVLAAILTVVCATASIFVGIEYTIAFSWLTLALVIWLLIKNRAEYKNKLTMILTILTVVISFVLPFVLKLTTMDAYIYYNDYSGFSELFYYLNNYLLPYTEVKNAFKQAGIYSLFPVPFLIALIYLYKKGDHASFLLPVSIVILFQFLCCLNVFPIEFERAVGHLEYQMYQLVAGISLANLYLMFYLMGNVTDFKFETKYAIRFSLVVMCILVFVTRALPFGAMKYLYFFAAELCTMMFLFIYWTEKKYKNVFLVFLVALTLIGGVTVNPIIKEKTEIVKPPEEIVEPV